MGGFFNGWRRKIGTVVLMMALASIAIWMRAHRPCFDRLRIPIGTLNYFDFVSCRDGVLWERVQIVRPLELSAEEQEIAAALYSNFAETFVDCHTATDTGPHDNESDGQRFQWKWQSCGFQAAEIVRENNQEAFRGVFWFIPHWMIALTLTLLSGYLLLSNPRQPKKTEASLSPEPKNA